MTIAATPLGTLLPTTVNVTTLPQNDSTGAVPTTWVAPRDTSYTDPDVGLSLTPLTPATLALPSNTQVAASGDAPASMTTNTTLNGIGQTGSYPADPGAAAGPTDVLQTVNQEMAIYDRSNNARLYHNTLQSFLGVPDGEFLTDPHVVYDTLGGYYLMVDLDVDQKRLYLAVSPYQTASGPWCVWNFSAIGSAGVHPDYPLLGFTSHNVLVTDLVFDSANKSVKDSRMWAFNRSQVEACASLSDSWDAWNLRDPGTGNSFVNRPDQFSYHVAPVDDYSGITGDNLVDSYPDGGAHVTSWEWDFQAHSLHGVQVSTAHYSAPTSAPEHGGSYVDTGQSTIDFAAVGSKSETYTVFALTSNYDWGNGNKNTIVMWMFLSQYPGEESEDMDGGFGDPGYWYFAPSFVQVNDLHGVFNYSVSGPPMYPSSGYVGWDRNYLTLVNNTYLGVGSAAMEAGDTPASYCTATPCYRWGDFSSIVHDPANGNSVWVSNMYVGSYDNWATRIARATI